MKPTYANLCELARSAQAVAFKGHFESTDGTTRVTPPTYPPEKEGQPPQYLKTARGEVRLDSPQSFANRLEAVIAEANLTPSFDIATPDGRVLVNSRELPHRVFDAAMRDSLLDGSPFFASPLGASLRSARLPDLSALYLHAPEALLFGVWDSHTGGGGLALRLSRAITARVLGLGASDRPGGAQKSDPLAITQKAGPLFLDTNGQATRDAAQAAPDSKALKVSERGYGSVPASKALDGVDVSGIELVGALHLGALRRYRFGGDEARHVALQAVLAALGIWAVQAVATGGMYLRSGCDLIWRDLAWTVRFGGGRDESLELDTDSARAVLDEAIAAAGEMGFAWECEPIRLVAAPGLQRIIEVSRAAGDDQVE